MATKAQEHRIKSERAAQAKHPKKTARRSPGPTIPREGVTIDRNANNLAGRRGGASLEESATGRPSRKSTRGSSDGTKRDGNQKLAAQRALTAPKARATRNAARRR